MINWKQHAKRYLANWTYCSKLSSRWHRKWTAVDVAADELAAALVEADREIAEITQMYWEEHQKKCALEEKLGKLIGTKGIIAGTRVVSEPGAAVTVTEITLRNPELLCVGSGLDHPSWLRRLLRLA